MGDNTKGGGGTTHRPDPEEPVTNITFYVAYPAVGNKSPDMFIVYDEDKTLTNSQVNYAILSSTQPLNDTMYAANIGNAITIVSASPTFATLNFHSPYAGASFDITKFKFAPIYLS